MTGSTTSDRSGGVRVGASKRTVVAVVAVVLTGAIAVSLLSLGLPSAPTTDRGPLESLPSPRLAGQLSLEEALQARRSTRSFTAEALTRAEIGQLLWAAQGLTDVDGHRTAPSAGALYPLELDVVTADGVARYAASGHGLVPRGNTDLRPALQRAAVDQAAVGEAPLIVVISGVVERTAVRYGAERAERYVALEAGHAAQNILLEAVSLELGAVPVGAFDDMEVGRVLGLADGEAPLYLIPVGHSR
jgi:SagB-type dehydrogenase family enzyme